MDSDIDLILLVTDPQCFRDSSDWLQEIGWPSPVVRWTDVTYGSLWSRHCELDDRTRVELGFASREWVSAPLDPGTARVLRDRCRALHDPLHLFAPHEFDFLEGEWDAVCRFPRADGSWGEGPGALKATKALDGCLFVEFFEGPYQGEHIKGLGLRAFNPASRCWEHTWTDTAAPGGFQVWRGRFVGGKIDLFGEWEDEKGNRILSRLTWSEITGSSAHWESHRSLDGGVTWTEHWVIDFVRRPIRDRR